MKNLKKNGARTFHVLLAMALALGVASADAAFGIDEASALRIERSGRIDADLDVQLDVAPPSEEVRRLTDTLGICGRATYLARSGDLDAALEVLNAFSVPRSDWPIGIALLEARVLLQQRQVETARERCEAIVKAHPTDVDGYLLLAEIENQARRSERVIETLEEGRKHAPRHQMLLETLGRRYNIGMQHARTPDEINALLEHLEDVYTDLVEAAPGASTAPHLRLLAFIQERKGRLDKAEEYLEGLVRLEPKEPRNYLDLAKIESQQSKPEEALQTLRRGIIETPDNASLIDAVASAFENSNPAGDKQSQSEAVLGFYRSIAEEFPGRDALQLRYARALLANALPREAITVIRASLDHHPRNQESWLLLAGVQGGVGLNDEARQSVQAYLALAPHSAETLAQAARLLMTLESYEDAKKALQELEAIDPKNKELPGMNLEVCLSLKEYEQAIEMLHALLDQEPARLDYYAALVRALTELGRAEEAIAPLQGALQRVEPSQRGRVIDWLAILYDSLERYDDAIAFLEGLRKESPQDWTVQAALGDFYKKTGREAEFGQLMADLERDFPEQSEVLQRLALWKWDLKQFGQAEAFLTRAIKVDPENAEPYNSLGYLICEQDKSRLDDALSLVQTALKLDPGRGHIIDSLGWIYFQKGEYAKAIENLEAAARLLSTDPTILEHLARSYLSGGRKPDAIAAFRSALSILELSEAPGDAEKAEALRVEIKAIEEKPDEATAQATPKAP